MTRNGFVPLTSALFDIVPAVNEQLFRFDGLLGSAKSMTANRPGVPVEGDVYLVSADPSWDALPIGTIAHYWGGAWRNYIASLGQTFSIVDQGYKTMTWTGAWVSLAIANEPVVVTTLSANVANAVTTSVITAFAGPGRCALILPSPVSSARNVITIRGRTTAGFSVSGGTIMLLNGTTTAVGLRNITGFPATTLRLIWDSSRWLAEYNAAQIEVGV